MTPAEGGADVGDSGELTVSVTSDEDSTGASTAFGIQVTDWVASSSDDAQSYAEGDDDEGDAPGNLFPPGGNLLTTLGSN